MEDHFWITDKGSQDLQRDHGALDDEVEDLKHDVSCLEERLDEYDERLGEEGDGADIVEKVTMPNIWIEGVSEIYCF